MFCPICRYNLGGLNHADLCPECGSTAERRAAFRARPRLLIPLIFGLSTAISVVVLALMNRGMPALAYVLLVFPINSIPFFFAWGILAWFLRPATRTEALLAALPPALIVLVVLTFAYYSALVGHPDAMNGIVILFSPLFAVPLALFACLLSFLILTIKRSRTANQRPGHR